MKTELEILTDLQDLAQDLQNRLTVIHSAIVALNANIPMVGIDTSPISTKISGKEYFRENPFPPFEGEKVGFKMSPAETITHPDIIPPVKRNYHFHKKACEGCGEKFTPTHNRQMFCKPECNPVAIKKKTLLPLEKRN